MRSRTGRATALVACLLGSAAMAEAPPCEVERGEARAVARIADGETLVLDDGRRVRLIGALAPRAGDVGAVPGSWPPENETHAALSALVEGQSIVLWHDAVRSDRYGQALAQVTVGADWLQGTLVAHGLARAYGRPGMDACSEALARLERPAREQALGLWANAAYGIRAANARQEWDRAAGSFAVVSGTVQRVSRGRVEVYLALAPRGQGAYPLAAVVTASRKDLSGGVEPRALAGRRVIVRGWIEQRRGPVIIVDSRGQLELVGE